MNHNRYLRELAQSSGAVSYRLLRITRHMHAEFTGADGRTIRVALSRTPSDRRAFSNQVAFIRRQLRPH